MAAPLLGAKPLTINRPGAQTIIAHEPTDGPTTTFSISASVQQLVGADRDQLPEGDRLRGSVKIYTHAALRPVSIAGATRGDWFTSNGRTYRVTTELDWSGLLATGHRKYLCTLLDADEADTL